MRKKIIHLIQALDSGGCENMLLRTLPLLANFDHTVITLRERGELAQKFEKNDICVRNIGQKNLLDIFSYYRLLKEINRGKPDLIITYLFHADFVGRLFIQIFTKYKIIPFLRSTYNHPDYKWAVIFAKLTRFLGKKYLATSEAVKNFYIKEVGVPKEKITVVQNGMDFDYYNSINFDETLRFNLGLKPNETVVICVANFYANKGHKYLLEAFEKIYKENKNIKLLLAGDGKEKDNLLKQIENYQSKNNILFLGKRHDVPKLLKISDIFVLPTMFEGMSNSLMEAMAAGLPVITTDISENQELIKNNQTGILVPIKRSDAIYEVLKTLIKNPIMRKRLSDNAKLFIEEKFALGKIVDKWNSSLNNLT